MEITVDNLNRATGWQDGARGSDILGNTTMITFSGGAQRQYVWDSLNRMLNKMNGSTVQATYAYRAVNSVQRAGTTSSLAVHANRLSG